MIQAFITGIVAGIVFGFLVPAKDRSKQTRDVSTGKSTTDKSEQSADSTIVYSSYDCQPNNSCTQNTHNNDSSSYKYHLIACGIFAVGSILVNRVKRFFDERYYNLFVFV